MDDLLLRSGLGRLIGLSLGLLSSNQLLACSLEAHPFNGENAPEQNDAVAIADLLSSSETQTGLDLVAVEVLTADVAFDEKKNDNVKISLDEVVDTPLLPESSDSSSVDQSSDSDLVDLIDNSSVLPTEVAESAEPSSSLPVAASFEGEASEPVVDQIDLADLSEDEWPSIFPPESVDSAALDIDEDLNSPEAQWPSITESTLASEDAITSSCGEGFFANQLPMIWLLIQVKILSRGLTLIESGPLSLMLSKSIIL